MKPIGKPTLSKNETLLFLSTGNIPHLDYVEKKPFKEGTEEEILNDYPILAFAFQKIISIPTEAIYLNNVNHKLFELIEIINPNMFKRVLEDVSTYNFVSTGHTTNQAIFAVAYAYIQAIQTAEVIDDEVIPLIILDEEYIKKQN